MNNLSKNALSSEKLPHSPSKNKMQGKATFETVNKYAKYVLPFKEIVCFLPTTFKS